MLSNESACVAVFFFFTLAIWDRICKYILNFQMSSCTVVQFNKTLATQAVEFTNLADISSRLCPIYKMYLALYALI